jgi:hypothetical protein
MLAIKCKRRQIASLLMTQLLTLPQTWQGCTAAPETLWSVVFQIGSFRQYSFLEHFSIYAMSAIFFACVPLTFQPLERVPFFPDTSHREERLWNDR